MSGWRGTSLAWAGIVLIIAGTIPALWAVGELSGGVGELPRHWWSTLASLPLGIGILTTIMGLMKLSRESSTQG